MIEAQVLSTSPLTGRIIRGHRLPRGRAGRRDRQARRDVHPPRGRDPHRGGRHRAPSSRSPPTCRRSSACCRCRWTSSDAGAPRGVPRIPARRSRPRAPGRRALRHAVDARDPACPEADPRAAQAPGGPRRHPRALRPPHGPSGGPPGRPRPPPGMRHGHGAPDPHHRHAPGHRATSAALHASPGLRPRSGPVISASRCRSCWPGILSLSMYVPAAHALLRDAHAEAQAFFYSGLMLALVCGRRARPARPRPTHGTRRHLSALLSGFTRPARAGGGARAQVVGDTPWINAWFEMVAAITTTGGSLYPRASGRHAASLARARRLAGGLFVWVAAVAILAPLRLGGFEVAEGNVTRLGDASGRRTLTPQVRIARALGTLDPVYAGLTLLLWLLLAVAGGADARPDPRHVHARHLRHHRAGRTQARGRGSRARSRSSASSSSRSAGRPSPPT